MARFHIRPAALNGEQIVFDEQETRHLTRVLRLGAGDVVQAMDGKGTEFTIRLEGFVGRLAQGRVLARSSRLTESSFAITLAQGVPKGEKMEWIVKTVTELGAARVVPLLTERCVVQLTPSRWRERTRRWQRVAKEAAKQCGRTVVPEVRFPCDLQEFVAEAVPCDLAICFWEGERQSLRVILDSASRAAASALLVVGPEGGLSSSEVDLLRAHGIRTAGLGPRILRTETAGAVGVALLQARFGDL
ncbi:MAG: 16S rRNA (uracil(1498)-N(3))-methyltransferase [Candidatus Methylomirabilia bacterium]